MTDNTPWLDYASERKGCFVGLANKNGSTKADGTVVIKLMEVMHYVSERPKLRCIIPIAPIMAHSRYAPIYKKNRVFNCF